MRRPPNTLAIRPSDIRIAAGDVTKFLDMCQDYYGLTRPMLTGEILDKQEMEWFKQRSESDYKEEVKMQAKAHLSYRCRQVCILGAGNQACDVLVMELLHLPQQNREHGMVCTGSFARRGSKEGNSRRKSVCTTSPVG